jgi:triosephosphate isomerase
LRVVKPPILIINFKNYSEAQGESGLGLARNIERAASESSASLALAPPTPLLAKVIEEVKLPIFAQHVDSTDVESSTGSITAASLASIGCAGSIINHSERRLAWEQIAKSVSLLKREGLLSVLCARDASEAGQLAELDPDFIAVEPPELIGTGRAVSRVSPAAVIDAVRAIDRINPRTIPLCGAGITEGADVVEALRLGVKGVLLSSAVVKNANPYRKVLELSRALTG